MSPCAYRTCEHSYAKSCAYASAPYDPRHFLGQYTRGGMGAGVMSPGLIACDKVPGISRGQVPLYLCAHARALRRPAFGPCDL